ncbi:unnamed protein product [Pleuronectes platessa]|uniref:Uncharacterized protein n=1 Tax=Pleuronectes platessa TaxID=8262 RepID=A0A9N7YI41_PLEPL|nr:unnamed protein product [Pleuronectes platessa]
MKRRQRMMKVVSTRRRNLQLTTCIDASGRKLRKTPTPPMPSYTPPLPSYTPPLPSYTPPMPSYTPPTHSKPEPCVFRDPLPTSFSVFIFMQSLTTGKSFAYYFKLLDLNAAHPCLWS